MQEYPQLLSKEQKDEWSVATKADSSNAAGLPIKLWQVNWLHKQKKLTSKLSAQAQDSTNHLYEDFRD
jgi:hypothetical protein